MYTIDITLSKLAMKIIQVKKDPKNINHNRKIYAKK